MIIDDVIESLCGCFALVLGIGLFWYNIKETGKGIEAPLGTDVRIFIGAIGLIVLGISLLLSGVSGVIH